LNREDAKKAQRLDLSQRRGFAEKRFYFFIAGERPAMKKQLASSGNNLKTSVPSVP